MWHEALAKHGASEILSFLSTFIQPFHSGVCSLVSYADSCGGQRKNPTILGMNSALHLAHVYECIDSLEGGRGGHTYLENNHDFGTIENRKEALQLFIPSRWYHVVQEASTNKAFEVVKYAAGRLS